MGTVSFKNLVRGLRGRWREQEDGREWKMDWHVKTEKIIFKNIKIYNELVFVAQMKTF